MGERLYGRFVHSKPFCFSFRRQQEAKPFVAAGYLCLEGLSSCISTSKKGVTGSTGFVLAHENGVVVVGALIEDTGTEAGFDHLAVDSAFHKVGRYSAVAFRCRGKNKLLFLFRWIRRRNIAGAFFTESQHRIHKPHFLYLDEIVEGRFTPDIPAFPMKVRGFSVDFEAVMCPELKFSAAAGLDQFFGSIPLQEFNGGHLSGCNDLLFGYSGHRILPSFLN